MHPLAKLRGNLPLIGRYSGARRGGIVVLTAVMMVVVMGFVAFTVDVGFIMVTKAQMESAVDSASLAASQDLAAALKPGYTNLTLGAAETTARLSATTLAGMHRSGDKSSIFVNSTSGVRFGQAVWNPATKAWTKVWNATPYNLVEVTANRINSGVATAPDGPLNLFFAPILGTKTATLSVHATAVVPVGVGVRRPPGSGAGGGNGNANGWDSGRVDVLPIALDEPTWNALVSTLGYASGTDTFSVSESGTVTSGGGGDGVKEINIYPNGTADLPSGNRGTVDIGSANNSTSDLVRQIKDGLSESDLAGFPGGELRFDNGPVMLGGDPGLSAGIETALQNIIGQQRLIPIFRSVSGNGDNAQYEIVKLVGVRVLEVQLTGAPSQKRVIVQPCNFTSSAVIRGSGPIVSDSFFGKPVLIR